MTRLEAIKRRVIGEPSHATSIGIHGVNLEVAAAIAHKDDFRLVGREHWTEIEGVILCESHNPGAIGSHSENLKISKVISAIIIMMIVIVL